MKDQFQFNQDIVWKMPEFKGNFFLLTCVGKSFFYAGRIITSESLLFEKQVFDNISEKKWNKVQNKL